MCAGGVEAGVQRPRELEEAGTVFPGAPTQSMALADF